MSENEKYELEQINNIQNYATEVGKNLKDLYGIILKYNEELDKENFPATLKLLPKISSKINNLNKMLKENNEIKISYLENQVLEISTWLNKQKDLELQKNKKIKYKEFFKDNLYEKSTSKKLIVEGRFPDFHCNNFKLKLDERKFSIKLLYGGDEEKMKIFEDWDLENILNYIQNFYQFFEKINLNNELKNIYESYRNCLKNKVSEEKWVPIVDILSEYTKIKQNNNEQLIYAKRIFFSFLIYKIAPNPELKIADERITTRTATHGAAGKSNDHLWIPTKVEDVIGQNIMYLSFKKQNNNL